MNTSFANIYNELLQLAQKHTDAGTSLQEIYGAFGAAQNYIGFILQDNYKKQATMRESEESKKKHDNAINTEPPLVETIEEN
jgi:hypothetical protein